MIYTEWIEELNHIVNSELAVDLDDLPDVPTFDDYESGLTPREAFEIYTVQCWDINLWNISEYCTDEPDTDASGQCFSDADPGL